MKRPRPLLLLCLLAATLLVAALGVPGLAAANPGPPAAAEWQGGAPHKVKASGPIPADVRKAAAAGDVWAQSAKKAWEAGGDIILLPDGSKVITLLDRDSAAISSASQAMTVSTAAASSGIVR